MHIINEEIFIDEISMINITNIYMYYVTSKFPHFAHTNVSCILLNLVSHIREYFIIIIVPISYEKYCIKNSYLRELR